MSGQSSITCLLPGVGAEAVLDGNLAVVKDNPFGGTAVAQPGAEEIDDGFGTVQIDGSLTPVNLQGISRRER